MAGNLAARSARPVMVVAAAEAGRLLASNTPGSLGGALMPSRLKGRQIVVASLGRRQPGAHSCAVVGADTLRVAGGAASPLAGLNAGHGGEGVDEVERLDHLDDSKG